MFDYASLTQFSLVMGSIGLALGIADRLLELIRL